MDSYIVVMAGLGGLVLATAWLPMLVRDLPVSLPILSVLLGGLVFAIPGVSGAVHPLDHLGVTERLTEILVLVALTGCGLKLDRPLSWGRSGLVWRLLAIAMPLGILAMALGAHLILGLGLAASVLLAAALAPTDPVLASDVQAGAPGEGKEDEVRFALTAEAGLNDGLAFPFVNLALAFALATASSEDIWADWVLSDVIWKLAAGIAVGTLTGRVLGWLAFRLPKRAMLSRTGDGFVALGITLISYGATELVHGYGFIAVFVAALFFRSVERNHDYHQSLHDFVEQLERLMMSVLLFLFGAAIVEAGLLTQISWPIAGFVALSLLLIRPLSVRISFLGRTESLREKWIIAFFGIRGVGTVYYLAYAMGRADFEQPNLLWTTVSLTILLSVFLHGVTVTPIMRWFDEVEAEAKDKAPDSPEPETGNGLADGEPADTRR